MSLLVLICFHIKRFPRKILSDCFCLLEEPCSASFFINIEGHKVDPALFCSFQSPSSVLCLIYILSHTRNLCTALPGYYFSQNGSLSTKGIVVCE